VRLGLVQEHKNYAAMYRAAQSALESECGMDCAPLISAHQLLKRHGQELCKRPAPRCEACPLRRICPYAKHLSRLS
jgi:endonuclease-3